MAVSGVCNGPPRSLESPQMLAFICIGRGSMGRGSSMCRPRRSTVSQSHRVRSALKAISTDDGRRRKRKGIPRKDNVAELRVNGLRLRLRFESVCDPEKRCWRYKAGKKEPPGEDVGLPLLELKGLVDADSLPWRW